MNRDPRLTAQPLVEVVQELQLLHAPSTVTPALVTVFDDANWSVALGLVQELRAGGINAEVYLGERRDLRRQVQYADRKGVPLVLFVHSPGYAGAASPRSPAMPHTARSGFGGIGRSMGAGGS